MERLSGLDAGFLYLEDAWQPMNGCAIWELDTSTVPGGYSFDRLRSGLSLHLQSVPRLRAKLANSAMNLDHPVWMIDRDFHIDQHLHRVVVSPPGARTELSKICGDIAASPLNRSRPLWEMWVIEGGENSKSDITNRLTLMLKVHHACMDAKTGTSLLLQLCSTQADAPTPYPIDDVGNPSQLRIALSGFARFTARPLLFAKVLLTTSMWLLVTLSRPRSSSTVPRPFAAPRTAFNARVTGRRNVAFAQLSFDDVKKAKNHFKVTVNDVVMVLVSAALRQFLLDRGQLSDTSLLAMLPTAVQGKSDRFGRNHLSGMFSRLETQIADPVERLNKIAEANSLAKQHKSVIGASLLQDWLQLVTPALFRLGMAIDAKTLLTESRPVYNLALSNVPGPQEELYFQGCRIMAQYPLGPVFPGSCLNITVMSLTGKLNVGITSCPDLVPDLWEMADDFTVAMDELLLATHRVRDRWRPSRDGLNG